MVTPAPARAPVAAPPPVTGREVRLRVRPGRDFDPGCLQVVETRVPRPGPGQALVRNAAMRVGAETRTRLAGDCPPELGPLAPGAVLTGPALGVVVDGGTTALAPGDLVAHRLGWREYALVDAATARPVPDGVWPDPVACLSQGFAGWLAVGHAPVRPGDTVLVTGAAGGVGTIAGQFARLRGATRVLGTAGTEAKAHFLRRRLGFDAVHARRSGPPLRRWLDDTADGVDVVVDTVGGAQLGEIVRHLRPGGRVVVLGAMASQARDGSWAPLELPTATLVSRDVTVRGITTARHRDELGAWEAEFSDALRRHRVEFVCSRPAGLHSAPSAVAGLLDGRFVGSVVLDLAAV